MVTRCNAKRWGLCSCIFIAVGTVAVFLVLALQSPHKIQRDVTSQNLTVTRPLDAVVLIDASGSMNAADWDKEVEFARQIPLLLVAAFAKQNATIRVALGQFATSVHMEVEMTPNVTERFGNLTSWQCEERWDDMCDNMTAKAQCVSDPTCFVRQKGFTEMGAALCGPTTNGSRTVDSCTGGAFHELTKQGPPDYFSLDGGVIEQASCNDSVLLEPLKAVLLVTDGRPMAPACVPPIPRCQPGDPVKGAEDAALSATILKSAWWNHSGAPKIFGVMVGSTEDASQLQSVTSCCPANGTKWDTSVVECTQPYNASCDYYFFVNDFAALVEIASKVVETVAQAHVSVCTHTTSHKRSVHIKSLAWLLFLLLPVLLVVGGGIGVTLLARNTAIPDEAPLAEPLRGSGVSCPSTPERPVTPPEIFLNPVGQSPAAASSVDSAASASGTSTRIVALGEVDTLEEAPSLAEHVAVPLSQGALSPGEAVNVEADSVHNVVVRKWAPVRTAYLWGGTRIEVDFGENARLPSHAPNAARTGNETASVHDMPETLFAAEDAEERRRAEADPSSISGPTTPPTSVRGGRSRLGIPVERNSPGSVASSHSSFRASSSPGRPGGDSFVGSLVTAVFDVLEDVTSAVVVPVARGRRPKLCIVIWIISIVLSLTPAAVYYIFWLKPSMDA